MKDTCACDLCRRGVRLAIERTFDQERRWMGLFLIRHQGDLGWVPWPFYLSVFLEMIDFGLLIESKGPDDQFPRYMLARLAPLPLAARKGGGA